MQSVRLKKSLTFPRSAWSRQYSYLLKRTPGGGGHALRGLLPARRRTRKPCRRRPRAKEKFDVGVGGFYQVTNASNGNFIRDDTTESGGALISFRQPWRPLAGI